MNLKKLLSLLLIFCMIFTFAACGGRVKDDDDNGRSSKTSSEKYDEDDEDNDRENKKDKDKKDDEEDEDDDKEEKDSDLGKKDKDDVLSNYNEVDLPVSYPNDIFPIYKNARVWIAFADKSSGNETFNVSAVCKDNVEKVNSFYKDIIKDSDDLNDYSMDNIYVYSGKYEGYIFTISCAPEDTDKNYTMFTIMLEKLPSVEALLEKRNEGELPDNYPSNYFPIVEGAAIANASESESDGKVSYSIHIYTDKTFKEILDSYEKAIGEITNKSKSSSTSNFSLSGEAHRYSFEISGYKTELDGIDLVEYWIYLYPLD
ncbi:MAG TPA: hypothetical protein GXZ22_03345 [Clostridiaceae bacterium]|nr:hypothetical protein [Clostridiaceae bacterium]